jgi:glutathione peroxidase
MNTRVFAMLAGVLAVSVVATIFAKPGAVADKVKDPSAAPPKAQKEGTPVSPLDFTLKSIDGEEMPLSQYKGKVVMLVNVASKCGNTPQYKNLEAVYNKYKDKGLVIVGIPANNFGGQEPGTEAQIKEFCEKNYGVTFPMASKVSVKGDDKHELYKFLTEGKLGEEFGGEIDWNFGKFLVDRNGNVMARFAAKTKPDAPQVTQAIEKALAAPAAETAASAN